MREALKLCIAELSEARCEVEEVMHNCAAALAGTEKGARRVEEYRRQLAAIDAALGAAEAALAQPEPEPAPVAWVSPRQFAKHDPQATGKSRYLPILRASEGLFTMPLYAGSAPAQSAELAAVTAERERCLRIVECYQVPVGNSAAGEMAADWTMGALREIRDAIHKA